MTTKAATTKAADAPKPKTASQPAPVLSASPGKEQVTTLTPAQAMEMQTRQWTVGFELFKLIYRHDMKLEDVVERLKVARASVFPSGSIGA